MELVEWYDLDAYFRIRYSLFYLAKLKLFAVKNDINHGQPLKTSVVDKTMSTFFRSK